ncbi:MAG: hypothetical protein HUJ75_02385 [Parasporobacterium sp.]|nr:hypothetical protein [Parasporobacterium sp.]
MKILNVLYQTDENYAAITGVSMTSLFKSNAHLDEINVFLLDNGISEENLKKYADLCSEYGRNLEVIDTAPIVEHIKAMGVGTFRNVYTVYLKMFVMKELKLKTDRIFTLDSDTLVVDALDEICDFDFEGNYLAATFDCRMDSYKPLVGLTPDDCYYNGGILLFNQKAWIENHCEEQIADHIKNVRSTYFLCEQDLMNVVFKHHIAYLPVRYNINSGFYIFGADYSYKLYKLNPYAYSPVEELKEAMKKPAVHHMMGTITGRPFEKGNKHPLKAQFEAVLKESPWSDFQGLTAGSSGVVKMQRFLHKILQDWAYMGIHRYMNRRFDKQKNEEALKACTVYNPDYLPVKYYGSEMFKKPLNVLYQANDYYASYLGVSLLSLLDNNKHIETIKIFVIDDGISEENVSKLKTMAAEYGREMVFINGASCQEMLIEAGAPTFRGNYSTYYKLFVLDELPEDVETILYVDSDTIVKRDLKEIADLDFQGCALGMVPAIYHDKYRNKVGISQEDTTFNAGIMAFNLPEWRKKNCRDRLIQGMKDDPDVLKFAPDQSLAIKVLQKDILRLDLKYNFSTLYTLFTYKEITKMFSCHEAKEFDQEAIDTAYRNAVIYHFIELQVGKPWEKDSVHPKKFLWEEYFRKSPWKDTPAPKVKLPFILKLQRVAYRILPTKLYMASYAFAWKFLMK